MLRQLSLIIVMVILTACSPKRMDTSTHPVSSDLEITLSRSRCFGTCPEYTLTIKGDGSVTYNGKSNVALTGQVSTTIDQASIQKLITAFENAEYYSLQDSYTGLVSDMPTVITSIRYNGQVKRISNYGDCLESVEETAPKKLCDLEDQIDQLSGAISWIGKQP